MKKLSKKFRKQLVWAGVVFILSISLMSAIYILGNKPYVYINPGITLSAPSPVGEPYQPSISLSLNPTGLGRRTASTPYSIATKPVVSMNSSSEGLYLTSKAQTHSVGGGQGGYMLTAVSHNASSRGIVVSGGVAAMPITNFVAMASTRQVAPPAAGDAPQMAKLAPRHAPGPPQPPGGGGDEGLPGEHQLLEQPIGEPWILALIAALYALVQFMALKRRKAA